MDIKEFPLKTQSGTFWTEKELEEYFENVDYSPYPIEYCAVIGHAPLIYTPDVIEAIQRYKLLNTFGVTSYSNDFDNLPCTWVDTLALIDSELQCATKAYRKINNG